MIKIREVETPSSLDLVYDERLALINNFLNETRKLEAEKNEQLMLISTYRDRTIELETEMKMLRNTCDERLKLINQLDSALKKYKSVYSLPIKKKFWSYILNNYKYILTKIKTRLRLLVRPKLFAFNLYPPRPLVLPRSYPKKTFGQVMPLISIVTPTFNHGAFLERTVKSIVTQDYSGLEYIVQDGGSVDNTSEILQRYASSLKHWDSRKDEGQSYAINLGFRHATGQIMAYLNSDDILLPGCLNYVGNYFATHPEIDVIYGHRIIIDESDNEIGRWILPPHNSNILSWVDYVPQETLFWRRGIWEKAGGYIDENFNFAMDWELILRFRSLNAKFARLPRFIAAFRAHPLQKTNTKILQLGMEEMQILRFRCHGRYIQKNEIMKAIRPYLYRHLFCHHLYRIGLLSY